MHALLAHFYHLAQHGLHVLMLPLWRAPVAAVAVAAAGRAGGLSRTPRGAGVTACGAVLAGWLLVDPQSTAWPPPPIARLPGLAAILLAEVLLRTRARPLPAWLVTLAAAALAAWWLRGAPGSAAAILHCMPVFLGLVAGLALGRRLSRKNAGRGSLAAALVLAAVLLLTGAAVHWARAALVPGMAALALLGVAEAGPALAGAIVMTAAATIVASDRGRLIPVDVACLAPLLAWLVTGWLVTGWLITGWLPRARVAKRSGTRRGT